MTEYRDDARWIAIRDFPLDDPESGLTFTARLARENGWARDFAARVVMEYRRFSYIAVRTGKPVTPSDEVDQAWHLHLLYSRSYWDEFCPKALGMPFHHGPTKGGAAEGQKFHDWYGSTLRAYEATFGEPPPADIWPSPEKRFRDGAAFRRINTETHWVVPMPRLLLAFDRLVDHLVARLMR